MIAASDRNTKLRQLSDEVSRVASKLAELSVTPPPPAANGQEPPLQNLAAPPAELIRAVIHARRLRSQYFAEELFADPAWDMMLDLLHAEVLQLRISVSSLCTAAAVPATTALRWIKAMVDQGLLVRRDDQNDGRRVFVELAPHTSEGLRRYFAQVGQLPVI